MSAFRTDGLLTTAQTVGGARKSFPFEGDVSSFIVEQDYHVLLTSYSPLALSAAHGTYTNAYLVRESSLENIGAGVVMFTRTYAQIPASRSEYGVFNYTMPGLLDSTNTPAPPYNLVAVYVGDGRDPKLVTSGDRVLFEYFLCAAGQTYTTPGAIPILPAQEFVLSTNPLSLVYYLWANGAFGANTIPSRAQWETLIAGGTGIGTGAAAGEFISEASSISRWMGDIYVRQTRYTKAK
jgi:hypothetical protein